MNNIDIDWMLIYSSEVKINTRLTQKSIDQYRFSIEVAFAKEQK